MPWEVRSSPDADAQFDALIPELTLANHYPRWQRQLADCLYRTHTLAIFHCAVLKTYSRPGEAETAFRVRLAQAARERRDAEVESLRRRHAAGLQRLRERIRAARERVDRQQSDLRRKSADTIISAGASVLEALLGRKRLSRTTVQRAGSAAQRAGRVAGTRNDLRRAQENLDALVRDYQEMERRVETELAGVHHAYHADQLQLTPLSVRPRKSDIAVEPIRLVWTPWYVDSAGHLARVLGEHQGRRAGGEPGPLETYA